jgi:transposase InsO family protein
MTHANARLTFHGRRLLVQRVRRDGRPVAHVAQELGVSRQCAHRWVRRFDEHGWAGLLDRSSRPHVVANRTPAAVEARVLSCRRELRCGPAGISATTGVAERTVTRVLRRHGEPVLAACDPLTGEVVRASRATYRRYEHAHPGSLVHVDVKKLGRIPAGGGWRAHGRGRRPRDRRGPGYDYVHALVDDHSRLAYAEILADERGETCAAFLRRAAAALGASGIAIERVLTDNAKNYVRSAAFQAAVADLGARHRTIRAHCPWQNGKVERFNRTLQVEWAYRQVFTSNDERCAALAPWLKHYNTARPHTALGGRAPISRLSPTS